MDALGCSHEPHPAPARAPERAARPAGSLGIPFKTSIDDSPLRAPSTPAQARQLAPLVTPGERLVVPPIDGTMVRVDPDQTLSVLAKTFRVDISVLRTVNGLGLDAGLPSQLFIPAVKTDDLLRPAAPGDPGGNRQHLIRFAWPTHGTITQGFWEYHPGIDIANDVGTPETAADAGQVVFAGWGSYGIHVENDHGNGFHTPYGHLSAVLVTTRPGVPQNPIDWLS